MGFTSSDLAANGESAFLDRAARRVPDGEIPVVFDVGVSTGRWAWEALERFPRVALHCFEPSAVSYHRLAYRFAHHPSVTLHRLALSDRPGEATLFADRPGSELSSLYPRKIGIRFEPQETVPVARLDDVCATLGIGRIHLLKIDTEGAELSVLRGARRLLDRGAIRLIQFEYGGTAIDAHVYLRDFVAELQPAYTLYRVSPLGLQPLVWRPELDIPVYSNYVAIRADADARRR